MAISELETLVRERIPLVAIIYNDPVYGAEVHHFDADEADLEVVRFPTPDIDARIASDGGAWWLAEAFKSH
jgi:thiamine pyrophosphate-dependent acetolactate synthase large subunit-like protein